MDAILEDGEEPEWMLEEREAFLNEHDQNKDGVMDYIEVQNWVLPAENEDHPHTEARHLINEADKDTVAHPTPNQSHRKQAFKTLLEFV